MKNRFFLLILFFVISPLALSDTLSVQLSDDLPSEVSQNIYAHLGALPNSKNERSLFIFSAKKKVKNALNALGYYRSVISSSVKKEADENTWILSINIILNPATLIDKLRVTVSGDAEEDLAFDSFIKNIPIIHGDRLNHGIYEKLKEDLAALGLERGYFDGKITESKIAINKNLQTADIILHFESGYRYRFGEITFNQLAINADVLAPLVPFKSGDFYQQISLQHLQNELDETQYFRNVVVRPETEKMVNNILPVDVSLEKAKSHQFNLGLGYATDTKQNFSIGWKTPLVNRYGHRQETKFSYSKVNPSGYFIYSIPLTHPNNDILQFKALLEEDDFGDLTSQFYSFKIGRVYLDDEMLRQPYIRSLTETWSVDSIDDDANYIIPGVTWSDKEWQGSVLDPRNGFRQYYNLEGSYENFNSETSFLRFNARWKYIASLAAKHRIVTRAEVGYISVSSTSEEALSPSLRFYAGGDQSIRGFAYQSVGPKIKLSQGINAGNEIVVGGTNMLVASVEYQYYFTEKWRGALFTDGGSVNNTNKLDLVYSVGSGIHYISPIGPIRFAVGYPLSDQQESWRVHFSIGAEL